MNGRPAHPQMRALRGPIMVITVGVLFAIGNFTPYGFDQTWPVLIIVAGLVSLLGRGASLPPQIPPQQPFSTYHPPVPPVPPPANPGGYRQTPYSQPPVTDPNQGDRR